MSMRMVADNPCYPRDRVGVLPLELRVVARCCAQPNRARSLRRQRGVGMRAVEPPAILEAAGLRTEKIATAGDSLRMRLFSPLDGVQDDPAAVYVQVLPTGVLPNASAIPGLHLDDAEMRIYYSVSDLNGGDVIEPIPLHLAGYTMWIQGVSRGPDSPVVCSDA